MPNGGWGWDGLGKGWGCVLCVCGVKGMLGGRDGA